jgi:hypothetical protein
MDQRANSISDLATSLKIELERAKVQCVPVDGGVIVRWMNPLDAEYADDWPAIVVHTAQNRADRPYVAEKVPVEKKPVVEDSALPQRKTLHKKKFSYSEIHKHSREGQRDVA